MSGLVSSTGESDGAATARSVSPFSIVLLAVWFGLAAGLVELFFLVLRVEAFEKGFFLRSAHFVWMVPLGIGNFQHVWGAAGDRAPLHGANCGSLGCEPPYFARGCESAPADPRAQFVDVCTDWLRGRLPHGSVGRGQSRALPQAGSRQFSGLGGHPGYPRRRCTGSRHRCATSSESPRAS